jgi:hypothetical protein
VLGGERFVERIRQHVSRLTPEHPRYERREVRPGVNEVLRDGGQGVSGCCGGSGSRGQRTGRRSEESSDVSGKAVV